VTWLDDIRATMLCGEAGCPTDAHTERLLAVAEAARELLGETGNAPAEPPAREAQELSHAQYCGRVGGGVDLDAGGVCPECGWRWKPEERVTRLLRALQAALEDKPNA